MVSMESENLTTLSDPLLLHAICSLQTTETREGGTPMQGCSGTGHTQMKIYHARIAHQISEWRVGGPGGMWVMEGGGEATCRRLDHN